MASPTDLLRALEFAHYAQRFRKKIFVIALPAEVSFQDLLPDIKVLSGYSIQAVLVLPDPAFQLEGLISNSNKRGTQFHLFPLSGSNFKPELPDLDFDLLKEGLSQGKTPIIAHRFESPGAALTDPTLTLAGEITNRLQADKLFLAGSHLKPFLRAANRSHVLEGEMESLRGQLAGSENSDFGPLIDFIGEMLEKGIPDIILLEGRPGELYQEVFTHDGAGLMFNRVKTSQVRQARIQDITDIFLLIRPEIETGRILPIDENDVETNIHNYWVYEIDGLLVGLARLKGFGDWAELAQFTTLPRYRGKGRARELTARLEEAARQQGFTRVFALSIDERMWEFFLSQGFKETQRDKLPDQWRINYDPDRASRAFVKAL